MNSAEKKAPEPSMDDIISSIRNIIADDTHESASAPNAETAPAPVIQLTENQIAEPVAAPAVEEAFAVDSGVPETAPVPQPAAVDPFAEAQVASANDVVPAIQEPSAPLVATAPVAPQVPAVPAPVAPVSPDPVAVLTPDPVATIEAVPPVASAAEVMAPMAAMPVPADPVLAEMATAEQLPEPVVPVTAPQAPVQEMAPAAIEKVAVADPLAPMGDMVEVAPEAEPEVSNVMAAGDPVEQMMRDTASAPGDVDAASNDVDPDQILEGMESQSTLTAPPDTPEPEVVVETIPAALENTQEDPVVLDASQVTPEDAAAITAVAAATSDALAGKTAPVEKQGGDSFEDSVKEMLKPMIREWLDDNMPRILEGAIKEEVKAPGSDVS